MNKTSFFGILLGVSLVLNGFLVGIIVSGHKSPPPFPPSPLDRMEQAVSVLSQDQQDKVKDILAKNRKSFDELRNNFSKKVDKVQAVLTAPTLDEEALEQAFNDVSDKDLMKENMKNLLTDIAKALPDDERVRFFKETDLKNGPRRDFRGPPPPRS